MSEIQDLRRTVETARQSFTRVSEQHDRSKKHLMSVIQILEERLREKRAQMARNEAEHGQLGEEYVRLSSMLHSLARTVYGQSEELKDELAALVGTEEQGELAVAELEPMASPEALRAGLKRVLKKQRARKPETPLPGGVTPAE